MIFYNFVAYFWAKNFEINGPFFSIIYLEFYPKSDLW